MTQLQNLTYKKKYKSPLEEKVAKQLEKAKVSFVYEGAKLIYTVPSRKGSYKPDFVFESPIVIESKGWLRRAADRQKLVHVKKSNPELDIRIVFERASNKIYKGSQTTYAMWADDNGFKWSDKGIVPKEWIEELRND